MQRSALRAVGGHAGPRAPCMHAQRAQHAQHEQHARHAQHAWHAKHHGKQRAMTTALALPSRQHGTISSKPLRPPSKPRWGVSHPLRRHSPFSHRPTPSPTTTLTPTITTGTTILAAVPQWAAFLPPVLPLPGPWGTWAALLAAGTFGLWSERFRIGKELTGALVATLAGMFIANTGVLPPHPAELDVVYKYILPLAIPMLLFSANLRRVLTETGRLLPAFLLGSATTAAGTLLAFLVMPLGRWLGEDGWKVATALTARHIGGAVNYMAVTDALGVSPSIFGAGLAADDLILALYFTTVYTLAKSIPPDPPALAVSDPAADSSSSDSNPLKPIPPGPPALAAPGVSSTAGSSSGGRSNAFRQDSAGRAPGTTGVAAVADSSGGDGGGGHHGSSAVKSIQVYEALVSLCLSAAICHLASCLSKAWAMPTQFITIVTAITVVLATLAPAQLAPLVTSARGVAQVLMQVFFATVGASANVGLVVRTAPVLFFFSLVALGGHLGLLLLLGRALGFSRRDLLLASNANIGGPSTVAGMAAAKGWTSSLVPAILTSTLGYALGTLVGMLLGHGVLRNIA